ncbi:hypothetical protein N7539_006093, partial [Penicillium diatomitis]
SVHENRIYSVNIHCGPDYPDNPPTIQFVSRVNIPCVDQQSGKVKAHDLLIELRRYMALPQHKKLPQPPEGSTF